MLTQAGSAEVANGDGKWAGASAGEEAVAPRGQDRSSAGYWDTGELAGRKTAESRASASRVPSMAAEKLAQHLKRHALADHVRSWKALSYKFSEDSLYIFKKSNWLRRIAIITITWRPFDWIMLAVIVANSVVLAMDSNRPAFNETERSHILSTANLVFLAIFTAEASLKILAMGLLLHPGAYLRDGWNILDFLVIALGYLELGSLGNYTAIRVVRALRPLRVIQKIDEMRVLVETLIRSIPMLLDVVVLAIFYFTIFGVVTINLFAGYLSKRCAPPDFSGAYELPIAPGATYPLLANVTYGPVPAEERDVVCHGPVATGQEWYSMNGTPVAIAESGLDVARICPWQPGDNPDYPHGLFCIQYANPGYGYGSFDNILFAWLSLFQVMTATDWVFVMYNTMDGVSAYTWPIFLVAVSLAAFFIVNLALAVLYLQFTMDHTNPDEEASEGEAGSPRSPHKKSLMSRLPSSKELPTGRPSPDHKSRETQAGSAGVAGSEPKDASSALGEYSGAGTAYQGNAVESTDHAARSLGQVTSRHHGLPMPKTHLTKHQLERVVGPTTADYDAAPVGLALVDGDGDDLSTPFRTRGAPQHPLSRSTSKAAALAEEDMGHAEAGDPGSRARSGIFTSPAGAPGRLASGVLPAKPVRATAHGEQERRSMAALMLTLAPEVRAELSHMGGSTSLLELASGGPGLGLPTAAGGAIPSFVWSTAPQQHTRQGATAHSLEVPGPAPAGPTAGPRPSADLQYPAQQGRDNAASSSSGYPGSSQQAGLAARASADVQVTPSIPGSLPPTSPEASQAGRSAPGQQQPGQGPGSSTRGIADTAVLAPGHTKQLTPSRSLPPLRASISSNSRGLTATAVLGSLSKAGSLRSQTTTGAVATPCSRMGPLTTTLLPAFSDASQQSRANSQQGSIDGTHRAAAAPARARQGGDDTAMHPQGPGLAAVAARAHRDSTVWEVSAMSVNHKGKEGQVSWHLGNGSIRAQDGSTPAWAAPLWWRRLRMACWRLQSNNSFSMFLIGIIIINAIFLGLQWYEMPVWLDETNNYVNYVITVIFLCELVVKLMGSGYVHYFSSGANIFDCVVTLASVLEFALELSPVNGPFGSTLSVLRAFRLLRLFRLASSWRSLQRIIATLMLSVTSAGYLTLLLLLFLFIDALLGMQLFGYKVALCDSVPSSYQLCPPGLSPLDECPPHPDCYVDCDASQAGTWIDVPESPYNDRAYCEMFPRWYNSSTADNSTMDPSWPIYAAQVGAPTVPTANFDDIYNAFVTVFQILSLDNWPDVAHLHQATVSPWAAFYFITTIIIGNFMILNLFLAILLDNFGKMGSVEEPGDEAEMTNWVVFTEPGAPPPLSAPPPPGDSLAGHIRTMSVSVLRSRNSQVTAPPPYPELLGPPPKGDGQAPLIRWASLGQSHPSSPLLLSSKPSDSGGAMQQQNLERRGTALQGLKGFINRLAGSTRVQEGSFNATAGTELAAASAAARRQDGTAHNTGASSSLARPPSQKLQGKAAGDAGALGQLRPQAKALKVSASMNSQASSTGVGGFFGLARLQSDMAKRFNSNSSKDSDKAMQKISTFNNSFFIPKNTLKGKVNGALALGQQLAAGSQLGGPLASGPTVHSGGSHAGGDGSTPDGRVPSARGMDRVEASAESKAFFYGSRPNSTTHPRGSGPSRSGPSRTTAGRTPSVMIARPEALSSVIGGPNDPDAPHPGMISVLDSDGFGLHQPSMTHAGLLNHGGSVSTRIRLLRPAPTLKQQMTMAAQRQHGHGQDSVSPVVAQLKALTSNVGRRQQDSEAPQASTTSGRYNAAVMGGVGAQSLRQVGGVAPAGGLLKRGMRTGSNLLRVMTLSRVAPAPLAEAPPSSSHQQGPGDAAGASQAGGLPRAATMGGGRVGMGLQMETLDEMGSRHWSPDSGRWQLPPVLAPPSAASGNLQRSTGPEGLRPDTGYMHSLQGMALDPAELAPAPPAIVYAPRPPQISPLSFTPPALASKDAARAGMKGPKFMYAPVELHSVQATLAAKRAKALQEAGQTSAAVQQALIARELGGVRLIDIVHGNSLWLFGSRNPFRLACTAVITNRYVEYFFIAMIVISSITLCLNTPSLDPESQLYQALKVLDMYFAVVFGLEAITKIVMCGFLFNGRGSYMRSPWNVLDLFIVVIQITVIILESTSSSANILWLRTLRALRALRPLRAASRADGIRMVVAALFKAIPALGNVLMVASLFYYIFAVLAVSLLAGQLYACYIGETDAWLDPQYYVPSNVTINSDWCSPGWAIVNSSAYHASAGIPFEPYNLTGLHWDKPVVNYDNVITATWALFQIATLDKWTDYMNQAAATTGIDSQPQELANRSIRIFYVAFIVVGSFFILNLVIGVSIDKFNEMKQSDGGRSFLLTPAQEQWLTIQKMLSATTLSTRLSPPSQPLRRWAFKAVMSNHFDSFMVVVILANVLVMLMVHAGMSETWTSAMSIANAAFTGIFVAEMLFKWLAIGIRPYFKNAWNVFDFFVVVISILGVVVDYATPSNLAFLPLLRVLRVARIFKLIPKARGLRMMLQTFVWSLPALVNVGSVLGLFMFMFAIVDMNLFGNLRYGSDLSSYANFEDFPRAMLTLFRCMTGENWSGIMGDAMVQVNCIKVVGNWTLTSAGQLEGLFADLVASGQVTAGAQVAVPTPAGEDPTWMDGTYIDPRDDAVNLIPSYRQNNQCSPSPILAVILFCSYQLIIAFLLLQLVIGIILDNIQATSQSESLSITPNHMIQFVEQWEEMDTDATGLLDVVLLASLLQGLDPPLGVKGLRNSRTAAQEIILSCDIPIRNGGCVHFLETLHALAGRVAGAELPLSEEFRIHDRLVKRLPRDTAPAKYMVKHFYAAMYVQGAIRGFLARQALRPLWLEMAALEAAEKAEAEAARLAALVAHAASQHAEAQALAAEVEATRAAALAAVMAVREGGSVHDRSSRQQAGNKTQAAGSRDVDRDSYPRQSGAGSSTTGMSGMSDKSERPLDGRALQLFARLTQKQGPALEQGGGGSGRLPPLNLISPSGVNVTHGLGSSHHHQGQALLTGAAGAPPSPSSALLTPGSAAGRKKKTAQFAVPGPVEASDGSTPAVLTPGLSSRAPSESGIGAEDRASSASTAGALSWLKQKLKSFKEPAADLLQAVSRAPSMIFGGGRGASSAGTSAAQAPSVGDLSHTTAHRPSIRGGGDDDDDFIAQRVSHIRASALTVKQQLEAAERAAAEAADRAQRLAAAVKGLDVNERRGALQSATRIIARAPTMSRAKHNRASHRGAGSSDEEEGDDDGSEQGYENAGGSSTHSGRRPNTQHGAREGSQVHHHQMWEPSFTGSLPSPHPGGHGAEEGDQLTSRMPSRVSHMQRSSILRDRARRL